MSFPLICVPVYIPCVFHGKFHYFSRLKLSRERKGLMLFQILYKGIELPTAVIHDSAGCVDI